MTMGAGSLKRKKVKIKGDDNRNSTEEVGNL